MTCVIGGGSTGAGVVRHAVRAAFFAVLVDRADIAQGTSGRLRSTHPARATRSPTRVGHRMRRRNEISQAHQLTIEVTRRPFVVIAHDDEDYADQFLARAAAAKVSQRKFHR